MIIKTFGQYVLRGRREAVLLALLFTLLPFLHWVSAVIIALITFRRGIYEGFMVLMWVSLPYVVLAALNEWLPLIDNVLCGSLLVWGFAASLRYISWSRLIEISIGLLALVIVALHFCFPAIQTWWVTQITHSAQLLLGQMTWIKLSPEQAKAIIENMAPYATGMQAAIILSVDWANLMIARYVEGSVTNTPEQLMKDWTQLRMGYVVTLALIACLLLIRFEHLTVLKDVLPVIMLGLLVAGMSLMSAWLRQFNRSWLGVFYGVIIAIAIFYPILLTVILVAAMIDSIFNIRKRTLRFSRK